MANRIGERVADRDERVVWPGIDRLIDGTLDTSRSFGAPPRGVVLGLSRIAVDFGLRVPVVPGNLGPNEPFPKIYSSGANTELSASDRPELYIG